MNQKLYHIKINLSNNSKLSFVLKTELGDWIKISLNIKIVQYKRLNLKRLFFKPIRFKYFNSLFIHYEYFSLKKMTLWKSNLFDSLIFRVT